MFFWYLVLVFGYVYVIEFILNCGCVFFRVLCLVDCDCEWLKFLCIDNIRFWVILSVLYFYVGILFIIIFGGIILFDK